MEFSACRRLRRMGVRLKDVAERAGVSVSTVSRVLGGRDAVAEATRAKVMSAVDEVGYQRSTLLGAAAGQFAAVSLPENPEHWQTDVARAAIAHLQRAGHAVMTPYLDAEGRELRACLDAGAAVIITPTFTELDVDVPVVRFSESGRRSTAVRTDGMMVGRDDIAAEIDLRAGMKLAFDHLYDLGHRRIGLVCKDVGELAEILKENFGALHPAAAIAPNLDDWIAAVPKTFAGGVEAASILRDVACTAVITQSALQMYGVFESMRRRRLSVPRDLSVIGIGDSSTMRFTNPPATVLSYDTESLAEALAAAALHILDGNPPVAVPPNFRPRLLARASTAAVRR